MAQVPTNGKNWNEFQWEREIRRDERRISCYFRELATCLDLPGEEGIIFDNLMEQPGLVPTGADPGHWRMWDSLDPELDDDDDAEDGTDPTRRRRRPGDDLVEQLDKLAGEWNVIFAVKLRANLQDEGLATACAFGKLLARMADFTDADANEFTGLKISLGKRALRDLNDLVGMLGALGEFQRSLRPETMLLIELLQQIRERLVDLLNALRKKSENA